MKSQKLALIGYCWPGNPVIEYSTTWDARMDLNKKGYQVNAIPIDDAKEIEALWKDIPCTAKRLSASV